uniref:Cohesin subunit SA n=1 Tax=Scleropages formosus TaxID=113540 RepID=A0A8C9WQ61_SCLFO
MISLFLSALHCVCVMFTLQQCVAYSNTWNMHAQLFRTANICVCVYVCVCVCVYMQRGKRRAREGSENAKRRHSEPSLDSLGQPERHHLKYGDVEAVTLFEVVTMGKSAMQAVVDDWIEAYRADRETALLDLISFFIQCSGCKGVVTAEMFQYKQDSDILSKMVEELDEDSGEYPLIMPGPYWKRFRSNFCEFLSVLVAQCQYSVIFDSYLMDTLISLLTELSDSRVRAFRHTCTLAAMKLLSALVGVALSLSVSLDNSQRLYEVERVKASCRRSGLRVDRIQRKIDELQDKRLEIENMMDAIFKGVFLKRYRDVVPDIRAICMEELGIWMRLYSSMFLNDSYLKYVGWMLHDKQPDVRLKCVQGLQALYGDAFLVSKLDLFTSRFKERMLSMALDKDHEVAVQAVRLLMIISESCEDVLSAEDCNNLYQLVFSSHRPLASIAGEFLYTKLLSDPAQADGAQQDGQEDLMAARVRTLIQFFRESELHDHVVYLVDSLWDSAGALLKNWTALTSLLFQDAGECLSLWLSTGLSVITDQGLLIEIMLACVRQAAEGPPAAGRGTTKKVVSAKERKAQLDDCVRLTQHFVAVLPELLSKFSEDAEKVSCLLKIPQYFHAEASSVGFPEKHLEALLAQMDATIERHTDAAVLEAGARTFQVLCCEDVPWHNMAQGARDQLVQRWVARLSTLLGDVRNTVSVMVCVRPLQVTVQALQCACYAVLWNLNTCTEVRLTRVRTGLRLLFLIHSPSVAFLSLCDLLTAHSYQLQAWDPAAGAPLLYSPDPRLQRALVAFVLEHVFTGTEHDGQSKASEGETEAGRLEELHRRRNLLAAYCKLIVHGVLEMSMAADVFKFYMKYYNDFGDIIKEMLSRTRQMDKIESARTLVLCLQQVGREQERGTACSSAVQTFSSIKELARRFSLTFGWDQIKSRESLAMIHRDGIEFVFQGFVQQAERHAPPNISYLTILSEFSSKLLKPDKKTIYAYLQKFAGEQVAGSGTREECWLPLVLYRSSLLATADCEDGASHVSCDTLRHGSLGHPSRSPSLSLKQSICDGRHPRAEELYRAPLHGEQGKADPQTGHGVRPVVDVICPDERLEPEPPPAVRVPEPVLVPSLRQLSATDEDVDIMDISP